MLRLVPSSETGWRQLVNGVKDAPSFFSHLTAAASKAGLPRGTLLRSVLPFDEDTSSNDQALGNGGKAINAAVNALLDSATLASLREQAVTLRRLIRVKMADDADLIQAQTASGMIKEFCSHIEDLSHRTTAAPVSIIKSLESGSLSA
jgi:hypothetical protein